MSFNITEETIHSILLVLNLLIRQLRPLKIATPFLNHGNCWQKILNFKYCQTMKLWNFIHYIYWAYTLIKNILTVLKLLSWWLWILRNVGNLHFATKLFNFKYYQPMKDYNLHIYFSPKKRIKRFWSAQIISLLILTIPI